MPVFLVLKGSGIIAVIFLLYHSPSAIFIFFFFFFFFFPVGRNSRVFKKAERRLDSILGPAISETMAGQDLSPSMLTGFHPPWVPPKVGAPVRRQHVSCPSPCVHPLYVPSIPLGLPSAPQVASSSSRILKSASTRGTWREVVVGGYASEFGACIGHDKAAQSGCLKQQKSFLLQSWRPGVRNEAACRAVLPPASASPSPTRQNLPRFSLVPGDGPPSLACGWSFYLIVTWCPPYVCLSRPLLGTPVTWDDGPTPLFIVMSPVTAAKTHCNPKGPKSLQRSGPEQKSEESKGQRVGNLLRASRTTFWHVVIPKDCLLPQFGGTVPKAPSPSLVVDGPDSGVGLKPCPSI